MRQRDAFAFYNTKATNIQWSWSAINEREKCVALTAWQDGFTNVDGKPMYHMVHNPRHSNRNLGYRELLKHIAFAREHCAGVFHVILAIAVDPKAYPRKSKRSGFEPKPGMKLKLVSFDEINGEMWAEVV